MCKRLGVSTSGYYEWRARPPSQRSINDRVMTEHIRQIHKMSDETYGRARVQAELRDMGFCVNHKRIERLMKLANLQGVSRRRGYELSLQSARQWGLYISASRGQTSIGIEEPELFSEPGVFIVRPDGTLYYGSTQTMPFARPQFQDLLGAIDFAVAKDYPARGEYTGSV
jgi:hypothetical protein